MLRKKEKKHFEILPGDVEKALQNNYLSILISFHEMQSDFLSGVYKRYKNIETANIILCFSRQMHLEIIRQREKDLNHDVSLKNLWTNIENVKKIPSTKISEVVKNTNIPKETVRRKINKLISDGFLIINKSNKGYTWNLYTKHQEEFLNIINNEIVELSKFIYNIGRHFIKNLDSKSVEKEINSNFSFYWYHFLSCQLKWMNNWQLKLKDNELLLIVLQALIPTLQHTDKKNEITNDNIFKLIGNVNNKSDHTEISVSASSVSDITGIPRATCIRKLDKLVSLRFLLKEQKTKRYYVNQNLNERTKNILTKENVDFTIKNYSYFLSITLNALLAKTW